jgi:hypothetical protein
LSHLIKINIDNISSINIIKNSINNFDEFNGDVNNNKNKQENEMTPRKDLENRLNKNSPEFPIKLDNFFEKLTESNSIFSDKEENDNKIIKKEHIIKTKNKKNEKKSSNYCSTLDIKNNPKTENKKDFSTNKKSNKKNIKFQPTTSKKEFQKKKLIYLLKNSLNQVSKIIQPNLIQSLVLM